uniref:Exonuclease 1 n=1 Tax=Phaeodactylum tricornutum TaxID=2850 RepID=A0A8J9TL96_PHATR
MGIPNLLQGLKFAVKKGNIRDYSDQAVAVDASSWFHKSVYAIADHYVEVLERTGRADARSIAAATQYVNKRCHEILTYARIRKIYLVMDGARCPLKVVTNDDRERRRQENLAEARVFRQQKRPDKMYEKYKACIKVKADLAAAVAQNIASAFPGKVELVWAPYEADAQLVKLAMNGTVQAIITEDSDVLVYAATCETTVSVLFKLDRNTGSCDIISMAWLLDPTETLVNPSKANPKKASGIEQIVDAFVSRQLRDPGRGVRLFVQACILTGCDYSPNQLSGVGFVNAFKHVQSAMHKDSKDRFRHVLKMLPRKAKDHLDPVVYEELLAQSESVFYYHPVREPDGRVVFLREPDTANEHWPSLDRFNGNLSFLGEIRNASDGTMQVLHPKEHEVAFPQPSVNAPADRVCRPASSFFTKNPNTRGGKPVKVSNPYQQAEKRPRTENRAPLQPKSPNEKTTKRSRKPFSKLCASKENTDRLQQHFGSSKNDVRFVLPSFTSEGARVPPRTLFSALRKPKKVTSGAAPFQINDENNDENAICNKNPIPQNSPICVPPALPEDTRQFLKLSAEDSQRRKVSYSPQNTEGKVAVCKTFVPSPQLDSEEMYPIKNHAESKFFRDGKRYARRVTLEDSPSPDFVEEPTDHWHVVGSAHGNSLNLVSEKLAPSSFDMYDDFLSPSKDTDGENITEDLPPETTSVDRKNPLCRPLETCKPKHTLRPAKHLHFRFGGKYRSTTARSKLEKGALMKGFARQRQLATVDLSVTSVSQRAPLSPKQKKLSQFAFLNSHRYSKDERKNI